MMMHRSHRRVNIALVAAMLVTLAFPATAPAQRMVPVSGMCDGGGSRRGCQMTGIIGGGVVGMALGGIMGQLVQIGEEFDARRASARAAADSAASTPSAPHP